MVDRALEVEHLRLADEHLDVARRSVEKQETIVDRLATAGLDVEQAVKLLEVMRDTLREFERHRQLIVDAIDDADE